MRTDKKEIDLNKNFVDFLRGTVLLNFLTTKHSLQKLKYVGYKGEIKHPNS